MLCYIVSILHERSEIDHDQSLIYINFFYIYGMLVEIASPKRR